MTQIPLDESIADRYAHDECCAFAVALHKLLVLRTVMFTVTEGPDKDEFVHAAVIRVGDAGENCYLDAYGAWASLEDISARYGRELTADPVQPALLELMSGWGDDQEMIDDAIAHAEELLRLMGKRVGPHTAPAPRATRRLA